MRETRGHVEPSRRSHPALQPSDCQTAGCTVTDYIHTCFIFLYGNGPSLCCIGGSKEAQGNVPFQDVSRERSGAVSRLWLFNHSWRKCGEPSGKARKDAEEACLIRCCESWTQLWVFSSADKCRNKIPWTKSHTVAHPCMWRVLVFTGCNVKAFPMFAYIIIFQLWI